MVGYPIGSTNVEPRKGYETLQSVHGTELKHPNQGENVRERFVNSLDPFGATLTSFTFGAPKALPRGARLRSRREKKLPPRQSIVAPKEVQRGLLSGGCGLEAESERQVLIGVKSHELTLRVYIIPRRAFGALRGFFGALRGCFYDLSCLGVNVHRVTHTVCSVGTYLNEQVPSSFKESNLRERYSTSGKILCPCKALSLSIFHIGIWG
jgi:hypothetical protein